VGQIQVEIILLNRDWHFREVKAVAGSTLQISSKTEPLNTDKESDAGEVLILTISSKTRSRPIPSGAVAHVVLFPRQPNQWPIIRKFKTDPAPAEESSPLEPPPADPPANPAVGCFFFSH
jgi:hypothetical protein